LFFIVTNVKKKKKKAGARVAQERSKLYETLKYHTSVAVRDSFYEQFHISLKSKKKKRRVSV
jgi:transcriptional regulator